MPRRKPAIDDLSSQLREHIAASALSHYAIANAAGVDAAMIGRFVSGERSVTLRTAAKLAVALGVRLEKISDKSLIAS